MTARTEREHTLHTVEAAPDEALEEVVEWPDGKHHGPDAEIEDNVKSPATTFILGFAFVMGLIGKFTHDMVYTYISWGAMGVLMVTNGVVPALKGGGNARQAVLLLIAIAAMIALSLIE